MFNLHFNDYTKDNVVSNMFVKTHQKYFGADDNQTLKIRYQHEIDKQNTIF